MAQHCPVPPTCTVEIFSAPSSSSWMSNLQRLVRREVGEAQNGLLLRPSVVLHGGSWLGRTSTQSPREQGVPCVARRAADWWGPCQPVASSLSCSSQAGSERHRSRCPPGLLPTSHPAICRPSRCSLLLQGHHDLHGVQGVGAQVHELALSSDLRPAGVDARARVFGRHERAHAACKRCPGLDGDCSSRPDSCGWPAWRSMPCSGCGWLGFAPPGLLRRGPLKYCAPSAG